MKYDPIKNIFGNTVRNRPFLRIVFYKMLGLMFLREWHVKRELRRLLANGTSDMKVYDAGSGFGQYSYFMAKRFPRSIIYAVDVKEEQIADCTQFFNAVGLRNCSFAVEDLNNIEHENRFDLILSVDVMEHIPDDVGVFRNFFRALRPNGALFINTPSNLGGSDAHTPGDKSFIEEHARNGYGAEEIRAKLESVGFKVEKLKYTYGTWGTLAWRLGIKYPMLMLNASKTLFILLPFYYVVTLPFTLCLMYLDYVADNTSGSGLNVVARKQSA
jgi:SAM-dependent methyltransferase